MIASLQAHADAAKFGAVTKTNVIGMRKALNVVMRRAAGWSVSRSAPPAEDVYAVEELIEDKHPTVIGELHDTGLKVLRNVKYAKRFDSDQRMIIEARHVRFDLIRFDRIGRRGEYVVPVFRIISDHGAFNFRNIAWQAGGDGPEVVE